MNRKIKFRGITVAEPRKWVYGDLAHIDDKVRIVTSRHKVTTIDDVILETVGEWVCNIDGTDAYEGDKDQYGCELKFDTDSLTWAFYDDEIDEWHNFFEEVITINSTIHDHHLNNEK